MFGLGLLVVEIGVVVGKQGAECKQQCGEQQFKKSLCKQNKYMNICDGCHLVSSM